MPRTKLTALLGIQHPIIEAGRGKSRLCVAACNKKRNSPGKGQRRGGMAFRTWACCERKK
jgi:hypothetical protein